jgi:6-pyruvoyltetrahydropterin/6-carboxytetrahydropterin synthase
MHKLVQTIRFESARKLTKVPKNHPCSNLYGLAFKLEIHVKGNVNPKTGFVVDFSDIERNFEPLKEKLDHNYLNDIEGLENPTSEILVEWIWNNLKSNVSNLSKLVLWENETSRVEYSGD